MVAPLTPEERQHTLTFFRTGIACLAVAKRRMAGYNTSETLTAAIVNFCCALDWAMPENDPTLWREIRRRLNEAIALRAQLAADSSAP